MRQSRLAHSLNRSPFADDRIITHRPENGAALPSSSGQSSPARHHPQAGPEALFSIGRGSESSWGRRHHRLGAEPTPAPARNRGRASGDVPSPGGSVPLRSRCAAASRPGLRARIAVHRKIDAGFKERHEVINVGSVGAVTYADSVHRRTFVEEDLDLRRPTSAGAQWCVLIGHPVRLGARPAPDARSPSSSRLPHRSRP